MLNLTRMMKQKRNILVLLGWTDSRLLAGIGRFAREHDWRLALRHLFERERPDDWDGDGALISESDDPEFNRFLGHLIDRYPAVGFGSGFADRSVPEITADHAADGELAASYFLERGYQSCAWFTTTCGPIDALSGGAFRDRLVAMGRTCAMLDWSAERDGQSDTLANRQHWLTQHLLRLPKPLALFAADDLRALDAIECCREAGLQVPEEIAVLGVGNMALACECSQVPVSSIEIDFEGIGYAAAALLQRIMDGEAPPFPAPVIRPSALVSRQSTHRTVVEDPGLLCALRFMRQKLTRDIGVEDIARAAGMPVRSLQVLFKEKMQWGPTPPARSKS
jgi:LacI family transcriptional regulator